MTNNNSCNDFSYGKLWDSLASIAKLVTWAFCGIGTVGCLAYGFGLIDQEDLNGFKKFSIKVL